MFYITGNNIEMTRGDTLHAVINMRDPLGVISYPETGDVVTFNAMLTRDGEAVITKTIPHDTMTLTLDPEDTEELAYGRYIFTVKITRANGDVDTFIDDGALTLVKTWRHKPHDAYVLWSPWIPLNTMNGWLAPGGAAPVDAALNISSDHPVQNKVLYQALASKVDKVEGMGLSHNDLTDALAQKLTDIETGATKTIVDALFVSGSTNPVQSKTIQAALAAKVDKAVGKGLSSNDYTSAEKEKLSGIEAGAQKNPDLSGYALKSEIHSVPSGGRAGQVLGKASSDSYDLEWVDQTGGGGGGGSVTVDDALSSTSENPVQNKVVKAALDGKADTSAMNGKVDKVSGKGLSTNDYTTTEKNKLAGIQAGAQVNPKLSVNGEQKNIGLFTKGRIVGISGVWLYAGVGDEIEIFLPDIGGFNTGVQSILSQVHSIPAGGTTGQFLVKSSGTDYDAAWVTVPNANGVSF